MDRQSLSYRAFVFMAALVVAVLIPVYVLVQKLFAHQSAGHLANAACSPETAGESGTSNENPNKMLFITCGGLIE